MDFCQYPQLTPEEFSEVCHHLDRRYCQATLGPLRRRWRLKICTVLNTMFSLDGGYVTFIQIIRPLEAGPSQDELSLGLENFSFSERDRDMETINQRDRQMEEAEEADEVWTGYLFPGHVWSGVLTRFLIIGSYEEGSSPDGCWPRNIRDSPPPDVQSTLPLVHASRPAYGRASLQHRYRLQKTRAG